MKLNPAPVTEALPISGGAARLGGALAEFLNQVFRHCQIIRRSGTTANRPTENLETGMMYFDTTLGRPIWVNAAGSGWVDATGASV